MLNQRKSGAILSYVSLSVNAAVSFAYVPILLSVLSTGEYGVYELIGSIIAYLSVMDMGLSTTLSRYYVRTKVIEGKKELESLLSTAKVIYLVLTLFAIAAGVGVYFLIEPLFGSSFTLSELDLARQMMILVILNCAIVLPGNWFLAIINAEERFVFSRVVSIAKYLLQVATVVCVLQFQQSALAVLAVQVAMNAAAIVAYAAYCKGKIGVRAKLHEWDWNLVKSLFAFSFFILLNMVFDQIFWKTGQVVLGAVCGSAAVAVYGIACKLITSAYTQVSAGVSSVFLPKLTAVSARTDDMGEIDALFKKIGRIQAMLVWGVCAAFAVLGVEFIFLWAGPEFADAYIVILVLMLGLCVSLIQNLGISILQAKNKMGFRSIVYIVLAVLDVVISIPVSAEFGTVGCAVVAAVLLLVGTGPVMNLYYHYAIGLDIAGFFRHVLPLLFPIVLSLLATWTFSSFLMPIAFDGWSWARFGAEALFYLLSWFVFLWCFGFNEYEKTLCGNLMAKMKGLLHVRS